MNTLHANRHASQRRHSPATPVMLHQAGMQALADRIHAMTTGGGHTVIQIRAWWRHQLRWGQNHPYGASEERDYAIVVTRALKGATAFRATNQITDAALRETVLLAERAAAGAPKQNPASIAPQLSGSSAPTPAPAIWSDRSAQLTAEERAKVVSELANACQQRNVLSSGVVAVHGQEAMSFVYNDGEGKKIDDAKTRGPSDNDDADAETETGVDVSRLTSDPLLSDLGNQQGYVCYTSSFCRMMAYDRDGTACGWGAESSYDWGTIDPKTIVGRTIERCIASRNPIRLDPGHYPVVLDVQAVAVLALLMMPGYTGALDRERTESGGSAFVHAGDQSLGLNRTKLGMKVFDERITIRHDPMDPRLGVLPKPGLRPVTWVDKGVLTNLSYQRSYAVSRLQEETWNEPRPSFLIEGGTDSIEQLIAKTPKGILVTRLTDVNVLNIKKLMATGQAVDLWQIENGKLTRAVTPMWFSDSPLLAFNAVEHIGAPVPIFAMGEWEPTPVVVPPMVIREFAFTATTFQTS